MSIVVMGSAGSSLMVGSDTNSSGEHFNTTKIPARWRKLQCVTYLDTLVEKQKPSSSHYRQWMNPVYVTYEDLRTVGMDDEKMKQSDAETNLDSSKDVTEEKKQINNKLECRNVKSKVVADDFMRDQCFNDQPDQSALTPASGEGHCSGACAFIPKDIRPLIQQAYEDSDFDHVDATPVSLPMLDDDGILRRQPTICSDECKL